MNVAHSLLVHWWVPAVTAYWQQSIYVNLQTALTKIYNHFINSIYTLTQPAAITSVYVCGHVAHTSTKIRFTLSFATPILVKHTSTTVQSHPCILVMCTHRHIQQLLPKRIPLAAPPSSPQQWYGCDWTVIRCKHIKICDDACTAFAPLITIAHTSMEEQQQRQVSMFPLLQLQVARWWRTRTQQEAKDFLC